MSENVRIIPKDVHEDLSYLGVGDKFELFGEEFIIIERNKDQNEDYKFFDFIAQKIGEERFFSYGYNFIRFGYEDYSYDSSTQEFEFTEVEKKIVPVVRWTKKK